MVWPLIWLGGAAIGALALAEEKHRRDKIELDRRLGRLNDVKFDSGAVMEPSVLFSTESQISPQIGSIVCCHVYGVIEHTGIWLENDIIAELHGSGLIRAVSVRRFLAGRSGENIYIASNTAHEALANTQAVSRATKCLFSYRDYDLFNNNCHRFVWYCLTGDDQPIYHFSHFNEQLSEYFKTPVFWDRLDVIVGH